MMRLTDGHTVIDTAVDPDGRIRLTVTVAGEVLAAPTFSESAYFQAVDAIRGERVLRGAERDAAVKSIAKGLGWSDQPTHWPAQVLGQLERDGLTITRIEESGEQR